MTRALIHFGRPNQPIWVFVESGGDNFGYAEQNRKIDAGLTAGSTTLTNLSGWSRFTATWIKLKVSGAGIPPNTVIVAVSDATHAVMSAAATATSAKEPVKITGGVRDSDCVEQVNLCVVDGNEYRATPAQVNSEVWMSIISGANGIEYFCHAI